MGRHIGRNRNMTVDAHAEGESLLILGIAPREANVAVPHGSKNIALRGVVLLHVLAWREH